MNSSLRVKCHSEDEVVGFIFARGGSKGIPNKNIRNLGGKPLIAWSIEQALSSKYIKRLIVSTDNEKIAEVAIRYGAEVPFIRPVELAQDTSPEWLAWQHALNYLDIKEGKCPNIMVSIPTTSPLRFSSDIDKCIEELKIGKNDIVLAISEAHNNPYFNMVISEQGSLKTISESFGGAAKYVNRQEAPKVYNITTVAYAARSKFVMSANGIFEGDVGGVVVPQCRALDIDTEFDFLIAEAIFFQRERNDIP